MSESDENQPVILTVVNAGPKLFQNLRSSRSSELITQGFPAYVVTSWLGHSVKVANKHYNQVTDDHFRRAVDREQKRREEPPSHGAA